jgi:hypothetical protein
MSELLCHNTKFIEGRDSYSEAFDPSQMERYRRYDTDTHLGDRPPTQIQQRDFRFILKASRKKTGHTSVKSNMSAIPAEGKSDVKHQ